MDAIDIRGAVVFSLPVVAFIIAKRWRRAPRAAVAREVLWIVALYVYLLGVARYTLLPINGPRIAAGYRDWFSLDDFNIVPFAEVEVGSLQMVGNLILTIPWGCFVAMLWREQLGARAALVLCVGFGMVIEALQLLLAAGGFVNARAIDVNDVIFNGVGAAAGYWWFRSTNAVYRRVAGTDLWLLRGPDSFAAEHRS